MSLIYLATPYSHESKSVMEKRYRAAVHAAGYLMRAGHAVFAPIAHSHEIGLAIGTATNHEFWMGQDLPILQAADLLVVLGIDGHHESRGVREEIEFAKKNGIPVLRLLPASFCLNWDGEPFGDEDGEEVDGRINALAWSIHKSVEESRLSKMALRDVPAGDDQSKLTNPKDGIGATKLPLGLVPASAIAYASIAHLNGALKYGRSNWLRAGVRASIYVDAAKRHIDRWNCGEEVDEEGVPHLASALACLNILIDSIEAGVMNDDRPPSTPLADTYASLTPLVQKLKDLHSDKNPFHHTISNGPEFEDHPW